MIIDGRVVAREGLRALLAPVPDVSVVGQAADVDEARRIGISVDVVVAGIDLSDIARDSLVNAVRRVAPMSAVLVMTPMGVSATFRSVLSAGADGYLLETAGATDFTDGIRAIVDGGTYMQPALGVQLARLQRRPATTPALSSQEEKLLGLLALGHTNAEVARLCDVSLRTVEARRARLRQTLGRETRAELVEYARETGLV
jgi:two-component system, NarL family, response regulator NreC